MNPILPVSIVVENLIYISNIGEDLKPSASNASCHLQKQKSATW